MPPFHFKVIATTAFLMLLGGICTTIWAEVKDESKINWVCNDKVCQVSIKDYEKLKASYLGMWEDLQTLVNAYKELEKKVGRSCA